MGSQRTGAEHSRVIPSTRASSLGMTITTTGLPTSDARPSHLIRMIRALDGTPVPFNMKIM